MPHWSVVSCFWVALSILVVATATVVLVLKKPVWIELETLAVLMGLLLSLFYTYLLYHGVQFLDGETISLRPLIRDPGEVIEGVGLNLDAVGFFTMAGASEGPVGCLVGLLLDILVCLVLAIVIGILLWIGIDLLAVSIVLVTAPAFYLFQRSLRFVMKHVDECHGRFWTSLRYGCSYAAAKTIVLCAIIYVSHALALLVKEHLL